MAKRLQIAKIQLGWNTYTIAREFLDETCTRATYIVHKAYSEWSEANGRKDHKVLVAKESSPYMALMAITSDFSNKQMVMVPADYLKELQALRQ